MVNVAVPVFLPEALVISEKEHLVFADGSTHRTAELIMQIGRQVLAGQWVGSELRKWVARLLRI